MDTQPSFPRLAPLAGETRRLRAAATPRRIDACVDAFAARDFDRASGALGRMCAGAAPLDACERVLTYAARGLGERWVADTCDFATLTLAMSRLHALLRDVGRRWPAEAPERTPRRALIAAAPGEQHIFGAAMLAEAFRGAGWDVSAPQVTSRRDLVSQARAGGFDLVALSVACDAGLEGLGRLIGDLRAQARGPAILVGGRPFNDRPDLAAAVGADGTAADCAATLALADTLTRRLDAAA